MRARADLLEPLIATALTAGRAILEIAAGDVGATFKSDRSPVTLADARAEAIILAELALDFPGIPVVAEEAVAAGHMPVMLGRHFFLVDPLDGTREFLSGNGEYTVNIALIEAGSPIAGVVLAPALGEIFAGRVGEGARAGRIAEDGAIDWRPIGVRAVAPEVPLVLASRSHCGAETEVFLERFGRHERIAAGSSLKFARLAEGAADLYPRLGRTMEWDTAAGEAVLRAAGGAVVGIDGHPLAYGRRDRGFAHPWFLAYGDPAIGDRAVATIGPIAAATHA